MEPSVTDFDIISETYSNSIRVGDLVQYTPILGGKPVQGVVEAPPDPRRATWGIWSTWGRKDGLSYMPLEKVTLVSRGVELDILGDNDDDCI